MHGISSVPVGVCVTSTYTIRITLRSDFEKAHFIKSEIVRYNLETTVYHQTDFFE
jgi:hypothetical protein